MRSLQLVGLGTLLGLSLLSPGCSSGGGGSGSGTMFIESCSLGCSNGQGGNQVSCAIVNVGRNVEIVVLFSEQVDLSTVDSGTFRIINTTNGSVPVGTYSLDPVNASRLIFRPALTFDAVGNPLYALDDDETYQITIPGEAQGDTGAFIRSADGKANQSRLQCTIRTTEGILDPVPGQPTQVTTIEVRALGTNEVLQMFDPANGATGVPTSGPDSGQQTVIKVVFNDIMNPATLANLSTGQSSTITVKIDPDGNLLTSDQVDQAGFFTVAVDFDNLKTTLEFIPSGGFPSGGQDDDPNLPGNQEVKRLIVMTLPPNLLDLVGNQLANPGEIVFRPELIAFQPIILPQPDPTIPDDVAGESFVNQNNEDEARSGASWGDGRLTYGQGGGSGRLGDLVIASNQEFVLDTDGMTFPYPAQVRSLLDNAIPGVDYDPTDPATWPTITVDDGAFEFDRIVVSANGRLVVVGSNPGRLFSRGRFVVSSGGVIDISGASALPHRGNSGRNADMGGMTAMGGMGGIGGVNAGDGGAGGNRIDHTENDGLGCQTIPMLTAGGILFPVPTSNPGTDNDGRTGGGLGGTTIGSGGGGLHWPPSTPKTLQSQPSSCFGNLEIARVLNPTTQMFECRVPMVAGPGGGGGYALPGEIGMPITPFPDTATEPTTTDTSLTPPPTPGGDITGLGLEPPDETPFVRRLDFHQGNLRGGSGGGGGGASIFATKTNATGTMCLGAGINIFPFFDHSAAAGGGGGGAVQLTSGKQIALNGVIDASGGDGGSSLSQSGTIFGCTNVSTTPDCNDFAAPGGGGSGGAVRMQGLEVQISMLPGRLDVQGGLGGIGVSGSLGGDASPGLVRIEMPDVNESDPTQIAELASQIAPSIFPYLPGESTDRGGFNYPFLSGAILSIGDWQFQRLRPDSMNAAMSCWMKPEGNFFELEFIGEDDDSDPDPAAKGWNMDIIYATQAGEVNFPYRGIPNDPSFPLTGVDFEDFLGQIVNSDPTILPGQGSLLAVRFQGARASGNLNDPCDVLLAGFGSEIEAGSLTPWVRHPAELNLFTPRPNMLRFCLVFEEALKTQGPVQFRVRGVTNLLIGVQPN